MRIRILRAFCLRPGVDVTPGEVVDANRIEALEAVGLRRAEYADGAAEPVHESAPEVPAAEKRKWGRK